jgi:hypothetical protein
LNQHVLLDRRIEQIDAFQVGVTFVHYMSRSVGMFEPFGEKRHVGERFGVEQPFHRAAIRMAHYERMFHSQRGDGVLDGRPGASVRGAVRRDQRAGVAQHEEIARLGLHQQVRRDAGIGASDQQRLRLLPLRKTLEQFAMRAEGRSLEVVNASNKFFHNSSPAKSDHGEDVATAQKEGAITPISF